MSEEVRIVKHNNGDGIGVSEWEDGLPGLDDLTPLSQALVPPELLSAFRITAEQPWSLVEVNTASNNTLTSIRGQLSTFEESNNLNHFGDSEDTQMGLRKKMRRLEEDDDSKNELSSNNNNSNSNVLNDEVVSRKGSKRARLVWTPQLHKRFVDVVMHLGIKSAVPKTIMQMMNVEGLSRENVASHLQKYRLYLKRTEEGPSGSDDAQMMPMSCIGMMGANQYHGLQNNFGSFPGGYHNHVTPADN